MYFYKDNNPLQKGKLV